MGRTPRKLGDTQPLMPDLAALEAEAARRKVTSEDTVELPKARPHGSLGMISSESAVLPLPDSSPSVRVARALGDRSTWPVVALVLLGLGAALAVASYS